MKTYRRYWLFQIPGIVLTVVVLTIAAVWFDLPLWACGAVLVLWIAKDAALYPILKISYEAEVATGTERLVGSTGVTTQALNPQGYVKIGAELWRARSKSHVRAGEPVSVSGSEAMVLIVEPLNPEP